MGFFSESIDHRSQFDEAEKTSVISHWPFLLCDQSNNSNQQSVSIHDTSDELGNQKLVLKNSVLNSP